MRKQKKLTDPKEVFELCKSTSQIFPLNYIEEFDVIEDDPELNFEWYSNQYEDCRKFTALLFCCSIASSEKIVKQRLSPYEYDSPFFSGFIKLIIEEAKKIRNQRMIECFNVNFPHVELTKEYICMEYLILANYNLMMAAKDELSEELKNLAYNYFAYPGTLRYNQQSYAYLNSPEKAKELNSLIGEAMRIIAPKVFQSVPS